MPIVNPNDAEQLDRHIRRFFETSEDARANVLREMFVSEMDFRSVQNFPATAYSVAVKLTNDPIQP